LVNNSRSHAFILGKPPIKRFSTKDFNFGVFSSLPPDAKQFHVFMLTSKDLKSLFPHPLCRHFELKSRALLCGQKTYQLFTMHSAATTQHQEKRNTDFFFTTTSPHYSYIRNFSTWDGILRHYFNNLTRVFCSMLFTVHSTGGRLWFYQSLQKNAKKTSVYSWITFWRTG
jgi:hypothetical protein